VVYRGMDRIERLGGLGSVVPKMSDAKKSRWTSF
jgi:hypothetical protein